MKKLFVSMLALMMLFSFTLQSYALEFSDVPEGAWYKSFVDDLTEKKVINGYEDGTFRPTKTVSVGEFLKLIMVASTGDRVKYDLVDAPFSHWAAPYLQVGINYGAIGENDYTQADLDRPITRIEIVRILANCDIIINDTPQSASDKVFTDTSNVDSDDLICLSHAVGIGVINGDPEGTFRPNDSLLRSECAKVIYTYTNR